jgi:hypothetical protein
MSDDLLYLAHQELSQWHPDHNPTPTEISAEFKRCLAVATYKMSQREINP